jgi:hypothetical protein
MSLIKSLMLAAAVVVGVSSLASAQSARHARYTYTNPDYNTIDSSAFSNFQDKWKNEY